MYKLILATVFVGFTYGSAYAGIFEATEKSIPIVLEMFDREEVGQKSKFKTVNAYAQDEEIFVQIGTFDGKEQKTFTYTCEEYARGSHENVFCHRTSEVLR